MNINFEYDHVAASERLEAFTSEKINKLVSHHDEIVAADVYFKTGNTAKETNAKIAGIRLNVPGTTLFAESGSDKFEKSIAETTSELQRQLRKYKEKIRNY